MSYECPICKSTDLKVTVVEAHECFLIQDGDDFETESDKGGDHIWDEESPMRCTACDHTGEANTFEVETLTPEPLTDEAGEPPGAIFGLNAAQEPPDETTNLGPSEGQIYDR